MDMEDQIPPSLPFPKGGIPLFGKEGLGEILGEHIRSVMDSLVISPSSQAMPRVCRSRPLRPVIFLNFFIDRIFCPGYY
jgi:hypothetical protein